MGTAYKIKQQMKQINQFSFYLSRTYMGGISGYNMLCQSNWFLRNQFSFANKDLLK